MKIHDIPADAKLYKCGSINQWKALEKMNIFHVDTFVSKKTKRTIRIYIWTDEITAFLIEWSKNKPKKEGGE